MSIYDNTRDPSYRPSYSAGETMAASPRPGLIWIPVAAILLLLGLIIATGFIFGDRNSRMRAYDDGTALEMRQGEVTMPAIPNPNAPEDGLVGPGQRSRVMPEEGPALANDGL
ncbi:MAG: hypothetical protein HGA45_13210 [Chloroflexales bacterium]|nr:hypothetical protein [Chloroflexales bacterium]